MMLRHENLLNVYKVTNTCTSLSYLMSFLLVYIFFAEFVYILCKHDGSKSYHFIKRQKEIRKGLCGCITSYRVISYWRLNREHICIPVNVEKSKIYFSVKGSVNLGALSSIFIERFTGTWGIGTCI